MNTKELNELLNSMIIVDGVEKRVRDCTRDEIEIALAGLREDLQNMEAERDELRRFAQWKHCQR